MMKRTVGIVLVQLTDPTNAEMAPVSHLPALVMELLTVVMDLMKSIALILKQKRWKWKIMKTIRTMKMNQFHQQQPQHLWK